MRKYGLLVLFTIAILLTACSGDEDNVKENDSASESNEENEVNGNNENENENETEDNEFALVDVSLDISEGIEKAYNYYDELYFSNTEIINEEIGMKSADIVVYLDGSYHDSATLRAYTIEPENTFHLDVDVNPDDYEDSLTRTDADGNDMAVEVADGAYEYAGDLIWKKDDHVYHLGGGRSVMSTNKDNEIHPEDDRLLFYENLIPTNKELEVYDDFYQNVKTPTQLPEGFTLKRVGVYYDQPQKLSKEPAARVLYQVERENDGIIQVIVYGEYEEAPKLYGEDIREEEILQKTVQVEGDTVLFTGNDETYKITYLDVPEETILEVAESIIEQIE